MILRHNFQCFKYLLLRFCLHFIYCKMPCIYWLHSENGSSPVFTLSKWRDISREKVVIPMLIRCKGCHFVDCQAIGSWACIIPKFMSSFNKTMQCWENQINSNNTVRCFYWEQKNCVSLRSDTTIWFIIA